MSFFVWDEEGEEVVGEVMEVWEGFRAWAWRDGERSTRLGLHRSAYMAERDIDTLDAGVPVLSMHAPFEVVGKLDCYMTYKGMKAVYEAE